MTTSQSVPPPGYFACYLRVDLSTGVSQTVRLDEIVLRRFLGGSGLGTHLLLREAAADADPLSPRAPLAFVFSPLAGSPLTSFARFAAVGKSPLTQRINDSLAGGTFAIAGKQTGCDAIVLVGRAATPSVVIVDDGQVRLEPAGDLWGSTCAEAEARLRERLGSEYQAAVIGPAGERQVRYALIAHRGRYAGRGGSGAVLGAKNVKAVAVQGSRKCRWANPTALAALAGELSRKSLGPATAKYRELGTAANLPLLNRLGTLPTRDFQEGSFAGASRLSPDQLGQTRPKVRGSCAACTIGCQHAYLLDDKTAVRPEYQNLFALASLCGVDDPDAVLAAVHRCDELGMDTISTGGTIAFAMECAQRGLIDADWLRFGDGKALLRAIEEIGSRAGLGNLMAEGSRRMAAAVGGDALSFAPQVKGLEIPGYEPRGLQTMALGYAVGSRGADHNRSGAYDVDFSDQVDRRRIEPQGVTLAIDAEDRSALMDSLLVCKFLRRVFADFFAEASEIVNLVTGWDTSADELRTTARRIVAAKKYFNILAGWQPQEDTLPDRFLDNPLPNDASALLPRERLSAMIQVYNLARGWTPEGWIPPDQLAELGLS